MLSRVLSRAEQQQCQDPQQVLGLFSSSVSSLVSKIKNFISSFKMRREVEKTREHLDEISSDAVKFGSMFDYKRERMIREVSCSHVNKEDIFGREDDTN